MQELLLIIERETRTHIHYADDVLICIFDDPKKPFVTQTESRNRPRDTKHTVYNLTISLFFHAHSLCHSLVTTSFVSAKDGMKNQDGRWGVLMWCRWANGKNGFNAKTRKEHTHYTLL